jgi:hypothetical protein
VQVKNKYLPLYPIWHLHEAVFECWNEFDSPALALMFTRFTAYGIAVWGARKIPMLPILALTSVIKYRANYTPPPKNSRNICVVSGASMESNSYSCCFNVGVHVSHQYKITSKIIVFYIPMFTLLDSWEDKKVSELNVQKHFLYFTAKPSNFKRKKGLWFRRSLKSAMFFFSFYLIANLYWNIYFRIDWHVRFENKMLTPGSKVT